MENLAILPGGIVEVFLRAWRLPKSRWGEPIYFGRKSIQLVASFADASGGFDRLFRTTFNRSNGCLEPRRRWREGPRRGAWSCFHSCLVTPTITENTAYRAPMLIGPFLKFPWYKAPCQYIRSHFMNRNVKCKICGIYFFHNTVMCSQVCSWNSAFLPLLVVLKKQKTKMVWSYLSHFSINKQVTFFT